MSSGADRADLIRRLFKFLGEKLIKDDYNHVRELLREIFATHSSEPLEMDAVLAGLSHDFSGLLSAVDEIRDVIKALPPARIFEELTKMVKMDVVQQSSASSEGNIDEDIDDFIKEINSAAEGGRDSRKRNRNPANEEERSTPTKDYKRARSNTPPGTSDNRRHILKRKASPDRQAQSNAKRHAPSRTATGETKRRWLTQHIMDLAEPDGIETGSLKKTLAGLTSAANLSANKVELINVCGDFLEVDFKTLKPCGSQPEDVVTAIYKEATGRNGAHLCAVGAAIYCSLRHIGQLGFRQ